MLKQVEKKEIDIETFISKIIEQISGRVILTKTSLLSDAVMIMEIIEKGKFVSETKLDILLKVLNILVEKSNITSDEKEALNSLIKITIPVFAGIICRITKGGIDINKTLCSCCFKFL